MGRILRTTALLAAVLAVLALLAGSAAATPDQVLADQADNGIIDGAYSPEDLAAAITLAKEREGALTEAAIQAVRDAQARTLFGAGQAHGAGSPAAPGPVGSELPPVLRLPEAPVVDPGTSVPVPFVILSVVAGLMLVAGIGASTFRRVNRAATTR
jgi:hypothetical protein